MAEKKKISSLPANYVSILQLQERWIKEKQLEKEEQRKCEEEQKGREEEARLKEEQDDQKHGQDGERCEEPNSNLNTRRSYRKFRKRYDRQKVVACLPKAEEAETEAESVFVATTGAVVEAGYEVCDEERNTSDSKKKNGKVRWKKKVEVVTRDLEPATEVVEKENIPARRNSERNGKRIEWRSKSEYATAIGKVSEAKDGITVQLGEKMEEVEEKFGDLSVNRRKGEYRERERLRFERNGGGGRHMASGRFGGGSWGREVRMPRNGSLVWVKKEEVSDYGKGAPIS